ncbi:MAG: integrin alpha [Acidobacteriota bacterium]
MKQAVMSARIPRHVVLLVLASLGSPSDAFAQSGCHPPIVDLSALDGTDGFVIPGIVAGDMTGHAVSGTGDLDGDGYRDVMLGAPSSDPVSGEGAVYVVFGRGSFPPVVDPSTLSGADGFTMLGHTGDRLGWTLSDAGDVNGDGLGDLALGMLHTLFLEYNTAYVVFGSATPWPASFDPYYMNGSSGFRFWSEYMENVVGAIVGPGGDVNGDGLDDVLVSVATYSSVGETAVIFGGTSGFPLAAADLDGTNGFLVNAYGALSRAGDVNGDGFDDFMIGDPNLGSARGSAFVVFGAGGGFPAYPFWFDVATLDGTNGFEIQGVAPGDRAGTSVAALGDVNGDGRGDLLVSAAGVAGGSGAAYVVYGPVLRARSPSRASTAAAA